jgi:hypothetical protein
MRADLERLPSGKFDTNFLVCAMTAVAMNILRLVGQNDQAPVWIYEGSLPLAEEEHRPTRHTVCAVQSLDGAQQTDGSAGMSTPESRASAPLSARGGRTNRRNGQLAWDLS